MVPETIYAVLWIRKPGDSWSLNCMCDRIEHARAQAKLLASYRDPATIRILAYNRVRTTKETT